MCLYFSYVMIFEELFEELMLQNELSGHIQTH